MVGLLHRSKTETTALQISLFFRCNDVFQVIEVWLIILWLRQKRKQMIWVLLWTNLKMPLSSQTQSLDDAGQSSSTALTFSSMSTTNIFLRITGSFQRVHLLSREGTSSTCGLIALQLMRRWCICFKTTLQTLAEHLMRQVETFHEMQELEYGFEWWWLGLLEFGCQSLLKSLHSLINCASHQIRTRDQKIFHWSISCNRRSVEEAGRSFGLVAGERMA